MMQQIFCLALSGLSSPALHQTTTDHLPLFNWNTVPLYWYSTDPTAAFTQATAAYAATFPVVIPNGNHMRMTEYGKSCFFLFLFYFYFNCFPPAFVPVHVLTSATPLPIHRPNNSHEEVKLVAAAQQIKALNNSASVYFYLNTMMYDGPASSFF